MYHLVNRLHKNGTFRHFRLSAKSSPYNQVYITSNSARARRAPMHTKSTATDIASLPLSVSRSLRFCLTDFQSFFYFFRASRAKSFPYFYVPPTGTTITVLVLLFLLLLLLSPFYYYYSQRFARTLYRNHDYSYLLNSLLLLGSSANSTRCLAYPFTFTVRCRHHWLQF